MSRDDEELGWAGGAEQQAAAAELERLKKLGEGLRDLTAAASKISDPQELAAIQDRNLQAFETMTADMGLAALDRMRAAVELLKDPTLTAAHGGVASEERREAELTAAQQEIEAARDRERAKLLQEFKARFDAASQGAAAAARAAGFDFEPFEGGPMEVPERDWDRGASPLAEMPTEQEDEEETKR